MCGIIGYVGERNATPILIEGIRKLEYRGYDSSGVGVIAQDSNAIVVRKTPGKIRDLDALIKAHPLPYGCTGISHTRWATHGAPSQLNAHPHYDCSKKILIVHNGIIENYESLKERLIKNGHRFVSQTDTEVISHLIEEYYSGDLVAAVRKTITQLQGAFAIGVIAREDPQTLVAARVGSPLIIGLGKNENYIASDVPAILDLTRRIIYLKDGEMAVLKKNRVEVTTFAGKKIHPKVDTVTFNIAAVQKQGFAHFMLKEIHEQPEVLQRMLHSRIKKNNIVFQEWGDADQSLKTVQQVIITACGTAYHAGTVIDQVIAILG